MNIDIVWPVGPLSLTTFDDDDVETLGRRAWVDDEPAADDGVDEVELGGGAVPGAARPASSPGPTPAFPFAGWDTTSSVAVLCIGGVDDASRHFFVGEVGEEKGVNEEDWGEMCGPTRCAPFFCSSNTRGDSCQERGKRKKNQKENPVRSSYYFCRQC